MPIKPLIVAFALFLSFSITGASQSVARLTKFQAYAFNSKTGQLSQDMLEKGAPELGNMPAGRFASVSTLVVVRIDWGEQSSVPENARVRLVAVASGSLPFATGGARSPDRTILDSTSNVGPVDEKNGSYIGFWLSNTGCHTVTLRASVVGMKDVAPLTGVLPFACYE